MLSPSSGASNSKFESPTDASAIRKEKGTSRPRTVVAAGSIVQTPHGPIPRPPRELASTTCFPGTEPLHTCLTATPRSRFGDKFWGQVSDVPGSLRSSRGGSSSPARIEGLAGKARCKGDSESTLSLRAVSMVRRGSTVRVRQRALWNTLTARKWAVFGCLLRNRRAPPLKGGGQRRRRPYAPVRPGLDPGDREASPPGNKSEWLLGTGIGDTLSRTN
jgi:hypothetical protein